MYFLINIVTYLSLFKKRLQHWCFLESYPKFLMTMLTFLTIKNFEKSIITRNVDKNLQENINICF